MTRHPALRTLPSVDRVLTALAARGLLAAFPRRAAALCVRETLADARRRIVAGAEAIGPETIADEAEAMLRQRFGSGLRRAINATGVLLHTNLGRAPLSAAARAAVVAAAEGYSPLEITLETGARGSRQAHLEPFLVAVSGAEAGLAVNNAAAAVVLALAALAGGREVGVSRGELVEIGGSFRLPEVMRQGGARLAEVGTTNRTYVSDYEGALDRGAALLLKVHQSNFTQSGFVHQVSLAELVDLGRRRGVPVVYDLGSGCCVDLTVVGLPPEPTVQAAVADGADLVIFSGDKLLGGPQAGVIVGRGAAVESCRRHPLARAFRLDKLGVAALAATMRAYLDPDRAWREIPILALLARPPQSRRRRAARLARAIGRALDGLASVDVVETSGEVGGGSLPGVGIRSWAVAVRPTTGRAEDWAARLRTGATPVVTVVRDEAVLLDVLALLPGDDRALPGLLRALVS